MNLKDFAKMLNGREYGEEVTTSEDAIAKELGFVIVYGASDDLIEFDGAIHDENDCYDGKVINLTIDGVFKPCSNHVCQHCQSELNKSKNIKAIWDKDGYSWQYETDIPHETFDVLEDGEKYCKGIVFDIKSLRDAE